MSQNNITHDAGTAGTRVARVRFEHLNNSLGIGVTRPRLSWMVESDSPGWLQAAYALEAHGPDGKLYGQTGRVESTESVLVDWPFAPLESRQALTVRARVWGVDGSESPWSAPAVVEAGLLSPGDWSARFITPDWPEDAAQPQPAPLLRKAFNLRARVQRARLYITALGVYEARINGAVVGDEVMAPGWTSYRHRLRYQVFDVTAMLRPGANAIGAMLGNGWFRGRLGWGGGSKNIYGDRLALLAQLEVQYTDGSTERIDSDPSWRAAPGPLLFSEIYDGEIYDARLERPGWDAAGYDDCDWSGVKLEDWDMNTLFAPYGPPVRRIEEREPVSIFQSPSGRTLVDFGQNLVGRLRITVQGQAGQAVTLRHAEVLENGELCTRPLRFAKATDQYVLKGGGPETWEPRFTFHGFRYAEVDGWPGELCAGDIRAVVCHSDMERTGWFECSDPLVNRLHENALWSMRGNFFDVPTDCPQRDERLGWTGDLQVFSPTASFLYDVSGLLTSWLVDLAHEQKDWGVVPFVVPTVMPSPNPPAAAWGDAAVVVPWVLYQRFGDKKVLSDQFESMRAWVDLIDSIAGERRLWDTGFQFGDWLDPAAPPDSPGAARTPGFIIATAYFAHSADLLGRAAQVIGREEDAQRYLALAGEVRAAFNREYVTPAGRLLSDSSTAYALALQFVLLPDAAQRKNAAQRLAALARAEGYRISTGFAGTPLICDALCGVGRIDAAYRLLTTRENPSWLYPVTMGATTIWERWDSMLPDGTVNPGEMTSFNHYALGAVADWMHRTVGGLAPDLSGSHPGYHRMVMQPQPGGGLTHASARHLTPYGMAACAWRIAGGEITVEVQVPPNTRAEVSLPGGAHPVEVGSGKHTWTYPYKEARPERPPLTLDSTIGELIDDPVAYPRVMETVRQTAGAISDRLLRDEKATIRQAIGFMPFSKEIFEAIEKALKK